MTNSPENTPADQLPDNTTTPDAAAEAAGRQSTPPAPAAPAGPGAIPVSTQSNMGSGAGIRGDYGTASQTNGLEGGPEPAADGSPEAE
ncbi:hypothetical protein [Hymenobacter fastidiosus]